jgi:hypothetical protein
MADSLPGKSVAERKLSTAQIALLSLSVLLLLAAVLNLLRTSPYGCGPLLFGRYAAPLFGWIVALTLAGSMGIVAGVKLPRRKVTNILQGLLLVGFGLCLALVPFEVFQRVTKPLPSIDDLKVVNHEMLGVWNKPNLEFDHQAASGEFSNHFVRDENGFILYTPEGNTPPDDARRVMMLGDSFLEGHQVAPAENMSALLQNSLSTDATPPYHVLNTGRGGFSPLRYLLAYRTFAPDYQPDVVVTMVYVGNDFTDDAILFHSDRIVYDSSGEIPRRPGA